MITWNEKKRQKVIKDHGVDFEKIENILDDRLQSTLLISSMAVQKNDG